MTLASMTGFARADGADAQARWQWEVRSVNGRGLDVRMRLPNGLERLEPAIRERVRARIERGSCSLTLHLRRATAGAPLRISETALETVLAASLALAERKGVKPPRADGLLALKGVMEAEEEDEDEEARAALDAAVLASLDTALDALADMRLAEGARLREALQSQLGELDALVDRAEAAPGRSAEEIHRRLSDQIGQLLRDTAPLEPARLHQEAAMMAVKADIREELDRLRAHVAAAGDLLRAGGAVGRRLDFLSQEFNRESNTICSKSGDLEMTRIGLDLKAVVDRFREQVQNVE